MNLKINGCWRNINDDDNVIVITLEVIFYKYII